MTAKRSRGAVLAVWTTLNLIRLAGISALLAAMAIQCILMVKDISASSKPFSDSTTIQEGLPISLVSVTVPAPINTGIQSIGAPVTYVTKNQVASSISSIPTNVAKAVKSSNPVGSDVPSLLLFPNGAAPSAASPTEPVIALVSQPSSTTAVGGYPPSSTPGAIQKRQDTSNGTDSSKVSSQPREPRYYTDSTVPIQAGGSIFAVIHRVLSIALLVVLVMGELGLPEVFLVEELGALSMISSPFWLGVGKIWMGVDMERHFISKDCMLAGYFLCGLGILSVLLALPLIWKQRKANSFPHLDSRDIYLEYNVNYRLLFWRPVPEAVYIRAYDGKGIAALQAKMGVDDTSYDEKRSFESSDEEKGDYPTFSGGSLTDSESQIERMTRGNRWGSQDEQSQPLSAIEEEDSDEEEVLRVTKRPSQQALNRYSNAPGQSVARPPEVMPGIPPQLQGMVTNVQPRFAKGGLPTINLLPSTPSTIASGKRSVKFPRPDSMFSTSTARTASSRGSTDTRRLTLLKETADAFPSPPDRVLAHTKAKPKPHLVNPPSLDQSKLMPPKKQNARPRLSTTSRSLDADSRHASAAPSQFSRPPPRRAASDEQVETVESLSPKEQLDSWRMPVRPVSAMRPMEPDAPHQAARRSVRFNLQRASVDSATSDEDGLNLDDILPRCHGTNLLPDSTRYGNGRQGKIPKPTVEDEQDDDDTARNPFEPVNLQRKKSKSSTKSYIPGVALTTAGDRASYRNYNHGNPTHSGSVSSADGLLPKSHSETSYPSNSRRDRSKSYAVV